MVNTIILVYVPPYSIYADLVAKLSYILLKIIFLTNDRNPTRIASAKWNFILSTEYPHSYKINELRSNLFFGGEGEWVGSGYMPISYFCLHFAKKFSC